jgi:hypothetical protein
MAKGTISWMFTRYFWLFPAGAAVGMSVAAGLHYHFARHYSQYTARVPFQVTAPPVPIGMQDNNQPVVMNADDTSQLINRQRYIFEQDFFLIRILETDEFHPHDRPNGETPWLTAHKTDTLKYLKRDLRVETHVNTGTFDVTFTSLDSGEAHRLAISAAKTYLDFLKDQSKTSNNAYVMGISEAVKRLEGDAKLQGDALFDYGRQLHIDVLKAGFDIQKVALQGLNDDFAKADAAAASAEAQYGTFRKLRDALRTAGKSDLEIADELISLEMKQNIENDFNLRTLSNTRFSWEQERAGEMATTEPRKARLGEIEARLKAIDEQIRITRDKLRIDALQRMEKTLQDEAANKRSQANYIGIVRSDKEKEVDALAPRLLVWDQKLAEVKETQDSLNKIKAQLRLAQANLNLDDTRVRPIGSIDATLVPTEPSWPRWYTFFPVGAVAGFFIGGLIAVLQARAYSRWLRTQGSSPPPLVGKPPEM